MKWYFALWLLVGAVSALPWDYIEEEARSASLTCNCGWVNRNRIVGGRETATNEYPLIVSLEQYRQHFCGGTIITPWHVLTAAHCTEELKPKDITVSVGGHIREGKSLGRYSLSKIIDHERYNPDTVVNDISILVTATQIVFNQNVGPACLPTSRVTLTGQRIKALGWGHTQNQGELASALQEVDLTVISFDQCKTAWAGRNGPRAATNVCTFEVQKDTCQGDSGGPLIYLDPATNKYTINALVSYGGACAGKLPGINTDVSAYLDWINTNVAASKPGNRVCTRA